MRFRQHINEEVSKFDLTDKQKDLLFKNCKPFLKDVKKRLKNTNHFLYRGITDSRGMPWIEKNVRQDRRPLDSEQQWHDDFGAGFKRKFGVNARSQGLFTEMIKSYQYGSPYIVIPKGSYYCIWSDTIQDAAEWAPDAIYQYGESGSYGESSVQKSIDKHVDKLMKTYHKGSVDKAIAGVESSKGGYRTEVTIICKSYYAVDNSRYMYLEGFIGNEI
jgi:hypothetical protein